MTTLRVVAGDGVVDEDERPSFDAFWLLYPKKVAKFDAGKAWRRLSNGDQLDAIIGVVGWRKVWMQRGELQFTPNAATWLNGHRWEDELPDQWVTTAGHASHLEAKLPEQAQRSVMPQSVKDALSKLRK